MIAHGTRMMYQGIVHPNSYYPAPTLSSFDFYFDWLTLTIVGIIVFTIALISFYKKKEENESSMKNESLLSSGAECIFPT